MSQQSFSIENAQPVETMKAVPRMEAQRTLTANPTAAATNAAGTRKRWLRNLLFASVAIAAVAGGVDFCWAYWTTGRFEVATDDAYVKADSTTIAPKVSGHVAEVLVTDNQQVKAGQVLARIDDRDFRVSLEQAKAGSKPRRPTSQTSSRRSSLSNPRSRRPRRRSRPTRPIRHSPSRTTGAIRSSQGKGSAHCRTRNRRPHGLPPQGPQ